jgi:hypothetical protein
LRRHINKQRKVIIFLLLVVVSRLPACECSHIYERDEADEEGFPVQNFPTVNPPVPHLRDNTLQ